jgi:hypothetical protein
MDQGPSAGALHAATGQQIAGMTVDQLSRDQLQPDQITGAIEIAQNQVEQLGALDQTAFQLGPFVAADQQRQ